MSVTTRTIAIVLLAGAMAAASARAAEIDRSAVDFKTPAEIKWVRNAAGTNEQAVLFGDPSKPSKAPWMGARDLVNEAIAGLFARPGRTALTVLGTSIGLAAMVATVGLARTAGNRIVGRFDELAATEIVVTPRPSAVGSDTLALPWDASDRLMRLNGVVAAGTLSSVNVGDRLVGSSAVRDPVNPTSFKLTVAAASPGLFEAVRADLRRRHLWRLLR